MAALSDVITPFENQKTNSYPFHASPVDAAPPPFSFPSLNFPSPVRGTFRLNRITRTRNGRFRFSLTQKFQKKTKKKFEYLIFFCFLLLINLLYRCAFGSFSYTTGRHDRSAFFVFFSFSVSKSNY